MTNPERIAMWVLFIIGLLILIAVVISWAEQYLAAVS